MENRTDYEEPELQVPSTPQPAHATLPSDIPHGISPSTSMAVADPSSPTDLFDTQVPVVDRSKYSSPPPPSSSMTPPPSSQIPRRLTPTSPKLRALTPTLSHLSSPPPTLSNGVKRESSAGEAYVIPAQYEIAEASADQLRNMLQATIVENTRLETAVREARMSSAHHKLQHNLLSIETEEAAKRMEVEHDMTRREVEVLQLAEQMRLARQQHGSPVQSELSRTVFELKKYCEEVNEQNLVLHRRLGKAKSIMTEREDDMLDVMEENRNLVKRIKDNREHVNRLKSPGGLYNPTTPRPALASFPNTPNQYSRGTPRQQPRSMHPENENSQDSFAALLLADRVLHHDNNSAPSTPIMSARGAHRSHQRHTRGAQSMSSLPSTPVRSRPMTDNGHLLPSVQFAPQSEPRYRSQQDFHAQPRERERSRKSRDSTISASDAEEIANYQDEDEDVDESQASQTASAMLRRDPRESFEVAGSPTPQAATEKSGLLQAKLFGKVTKSGVEKRKRVDDGEGLAAKAMRVADAGVGLGLGLGSWA